MQDPGLCEANGESLSGGRARIVSYERGIIPEAGLGPDRDYLQQTTLESD